MTKLIKIDNWGDYVMEHLYSFQVKSEQCDLSLMCNNQQIKVHRAVVCACSEYFRNITKRVETIILPNDIPFDTLKDIIRFMYTGKLEVTEENKKHLLFAVDLMKIPIRPKILEYDSENAIMKMPLQNGNGSTQLHNISDAKSTIVVASTGRHMKRKRDVHNGKVVINEKLKSMFSPYEKYPKLRTNLPRYWADFNSMKMDEVSRPLRFELPEEKCAKVYYPTFNNISYETEPLDKEIEFLNNPQSSEDQQCSVDDELRDSMDNTSSHTDIQSDTKNTGSNSIFDAQNIQMEVDENNMECVNTETQLSVLDSASVNTSSDNIQNLSENQNEIADVTSEMIPMEEDNLASTSQIVNNRVSPDNVVKDELPDNVEVTLNDDDRNELSIISEIPSVKNKTLPEIPDAIPISRALNDLKKNYEKCLIKNKAKDVNTPKRILRCRPTTVLQEHKLQMPSNSSAEVSLIKDVSNPSKISESPRKPSERGVTSGSKNIEDNTEASLTVTNAKERLSVLPNISVISEAKITSAKSNQMTEASDIQKILEAEDVPKLPECSELLKTSVTECLDDQIKLEIKNMGGNEINSRRSVIVKGVSSMDLSKHSKLIESVLKSLPNLPEGKNICLKINSSANLSDIDTKQVVVVNDNAKVDFKNVTEENPESDTYVPELSIDNVSGPWLCASCGTKEIPLCFDTYKTYREHLHKSHNFDKDSRCKLCGHRSVRRNVQLYHLYTQHNIEPPEYVKFPTCSVCGYVALSKLVFDRHMTHHSETTYTCQCQGTYKSKEELNQHLLTCDKLSKKREYNCTLCMVSFDRMINLKAHVRINHKHLMHKLLSVLELDEPEETEANNSEIIKEATSVSEAKSTSQLDIKEEKHESVMENGIKNEITTAC